MKKGIIFLGIILSFFGTFGQSVILRTTGTNTINDPRQEHTINLVVPRYTDTTSNPGGANYAANIGIDSCGAVIFTYSDNSIWIRQCSPKRWALVGSFNGVDSIYVEQPIAVKLGISGASTGKQVIYFLKESGLISGGVPFSTGCRTLTMPPSVYNINFNQYSSISTNLTIDTSHATLNRTDRIVGDTNNLVYVIKGTPSSLGLAPSYNPSSQFSLALISIPAAATCTPSSASSKIVYDQNLGVAGGEYDITTTGTISADRNNLNNPYHLTKGIFISSYSDSSQIVATNTGLQDTVTSTSVFVLPTYLNNRLTNPIQVQFFLNTTSVSNNTVINSFINTLDTGQYQVATIPITAFGFSSSYFNKIVFTFRGYDTSGARGLYLDYIQLQKGITNTSSGIFVDSTKIISGSEYYYKGGIPYLAGSVGGLTGSGGFGRVTYWDGTTSITSDSSFRFAPLGHLTTTKTYSGLVLKPTPTAANNTDTLVGLELTNTYKPNTKTGIINQAIKINKAFINLDSSYNFSVGDAQASRSSNTTIIGAGAGGGATGADYSAFIGYYAGFLATNAYDALFVGRSSGYGATNANQSFFMGNQAGLNATNASTSVFLGANAGGSATNAANSVFIGSSAGNIASGAYSSNFLGINAGNGATSAFGSNFLGGSSGLSATGASNSNFIGGAAGQSATNASSSNFFGNQTGLQATNASSSNFFGKQAGQQATNASNSNFLGENAGLASTGASYSNFFGYRVGDSVQFKITGSNNIMIGTNITLPTAATANSLNIGNVLYGRGLYSTTSGSPATAAQTTGQIGINVNVPAASAALDVTSTTMGALIPRMTTTQKNAISSPAEGLIVYDLTLHKLCVYTGSAWETITSL